MTEGDDSSRAAPGSEPASQSDSGSSASESVDSGGTASGGTGSEATGSGQSGTPAPAPAQGKKLPTGMLALLAIAAVKFKSLGWVLGSLIGLVLSVGMYTQLFGLGYALTLIVLIFIHESGHWMWMKALGLNPKAPMFVPGLGAFVAMQNLPDNQATHAWVALAGPLVGGAGCAIMCVCGVVSGNNSLVAAASTGFSLNLLQLIPARPFDGGFVVQAISRYMLIPGTILLFAVGLMMQSSLLLIIGVISLLNWRKSVAPSPAVPATGWQKFGIALAYLALIGTLMIGMTVASLELGDIQG